MIKNETYKQSGKEAFHILICLIQVWDYSKENFMKPPKNCLEIAEVESIQVSDSYKQLINKATVRFPRGTVIRKTSETIEEVKKDAEKVDATLDSHGVLLTTRKTYSQAATVTDFAYGKRIRIFVGYTTDPRIASLPKFNAQTRKSIFNDDSLHQEYFDAIKGSGPIFDGYITRCSIDTPIEIECEDLASVLKQYNAPNIPKPKELTVNDLLADDGKYHMLKDTGFTLAPATKSCNINIGKAEFNRDLTVADVLTTWTKFKLFSYVWVKYDDDMGGTPYIVVGRSYFSNGGKDSILKQREEQGYAREYEIYFNYNVAANGLSLTESNKDFLCIQGQSMDKNGKFYSLTLRINPEWHEGDPPKDKWQILNEVTLSKKMQRMGATVMSKGKNKVDLNRYTVVPYMSAKIGATHEELLQELIQYYEAFNMNGIQGNLTLFGDFQLRSGCKVHLYDDYYPAKNGVYFVDEVTTQFGNGGFRQVIKLPYLISSDSKDEANK